MCVLKVIIEISFKDTGMLWSLPLAFYPQGCDLSQITVPWPTVSLSNEIAVGT